MHYVATFNGQGLSVMFRSGRLFAVALVPPRDWELGWSHCEQHHVLAFYFGPLRLIWARWHHLPVAERSA